MVTDLKRGVLGAAIAAVLVVGTLAVPTVGGFGGQVASAAESSSSDGTEFGGGAGARKVCKVVQGDVLVCYWTK